MITVRLCTSGWWFVNVDEELGWVPAAYLETIRPEDEDDSQNTRFAPGQGIRLFVFIDDLPC